MSIYLSKKIDTSISIIIFGKITTGWKLIFCLKMQMHLMYMRSNLLGHWAALFLKI